MTLNQVPVGSIARISGSSGARDRRLSTAGLRDGVEVHVMRRTAGGGRLLGIGPSRLAVDRATVTALTVEMPA